MRCGKGQLAAIGGLNVKKIIRFERFTNSSLRLCRMYLACHRDKSHESGNLEIVEHE